MVQQADSQDVLSQLVETLRLEPGCAHVQHALVRVRRADSELANALNDGTEAEVDASWVRLRGRLEELEEAFLCAGAGPRLAAAARAARAVYERLVPQALAARVANADGTKNDDDDDERRRKGKAKVPPQAAELDVASARIIATLPAPSSSVRSQAFDLAYTSFLLATAPSRVLPPGKTLHEALHARSFPLPSPPPQLAIEAAESPERRDQHELAAGRLTPFVKVLAPSSPPESRTRGWNRLKAALWDAAKALVLKERRDRAEGARASLEAAFRPDPDEAAFSVSRATALLHSLVLTLADLCSAARDVEVNPIISTLSAPIVPSKVTPERPTRIPASNLSLTTLVEAVRDLVKLSRDMTSDLDLFKQTVSSAIDDELLVKIAACENERTAINLVYPGPDSVQESVLRWLVRRGEASVRTTWLATAAKPADAEATRGALIASALVETIFADSAVGVEKAVGMPARTSRTNALPAILVVQSPAIFRLQNFVQALTIVACLASLAGVPAPHAPAPDPLGDEWASRLWTLLRADLDTDTVSSRGAITLEQADSAPVVLADLADEILRVRRLSRGEALDSRFEVEDRVVRASVNRIIQSEDPVYRLLKARAKDAVLHALKRPSGLALGVPASMHTGIMGLQGKKHEKRKLVVPAVKGFSRQPLLGRKLAELAEHVAGIVAWSADVWGDQLAFVAV